MKKILFLLLLFNTVIATAHGSDASTMILVEQEDNTWSLHLNASIEAFRKEIKFHFSDTPYTSKEMFRKQVLEYIKSTLKISVNNEGQLSLENGFVKLGHDTTVFFNKLNIPENLTGLKVDGGIFRDIYGSNLKLLILKKGVNKNPLVLNKRNNYTADLLLNGQKFELVAKKQKASNFSSTSILLGIIGLLSIVSFVFYRKTMRNNVDLMANG